MTQDQRTIVNSKAYWESVERKKLEIKNAKPMTDEQVAFLHKHYGKDSKYDPYSKENL